MQPRPSQVPQSNVGASDFGSATDQRALDALFAALLLTSVATHLAGNILLLNPTVFAGTSLILVPIAGFWALFYTVSRIAGSVLCGAIAAFAAVFVCCRLASYGGAAVFALCCVLSAGYMLRFCRPPSGSVVVLAAMAALGAATALSSPGTFTYFDNLEWAKGRYMHQDVAYHSAIAAMIKNHGTVSLGLHGLVELPYYALLHHFAALVSALSGRGTLEVWGVLVYIFCLPLLMFAGSYAALRASMRGLVVPFAWSLVCLALASPQFSVLVERLLALHFLYFSETYVLSTALLLLCVPLLLKGTFKWSDVLLAAATMFMVSYIKGATAAILAGLLGARWLVTERARFGPGLVAVISACVVFAAFIFGFTRMMQVSDGGLTTEVLHIVRMGPGGGAVTEALQRFGAGEYLGMPLLVRAAASTLFFFATHFALSWIALFILVRRGGWLSLYTDPRAVLVWSSALGGIFFAFFFTSPGGINIWYFTNAAFFVALPILIGVAATGNEWMKTPQRQLVWMALLLVVILGASYKSYYRQSFLAPLRRELPASDPFVAEMLNLREKTPVDAFLRADERAWLIEPTYHKDKPGRWPAPFAFVALSERAWINIIRPLVPGPSYAYKDWGFGFYGIDPATDRVTITPVVPAGSEVRDWPPSREILEAEPKVAARIAAAWRRIFGDQ